MKKFNGVLLTALLSSAVLLGACGGGGGGSDSLIASPSTTSFRLASSARNEAVGANCAGGGARIDSGFDANNNGVLDANEIASTQYVCNGTNGVNGINGANGASGSNGTNGANGLNALLSATAEPAGANCANGGYRIDVGSDSNNNAVLDVAEIISTQYVCHGINGTNGTNGTNGANGAAGINGANGANGTNGVAGANGTNGTNGADGLTSLMAIVPESAGANCKYGGSKITSGLDTNRNSALDGNEVTITSYTCNGPPSGLTWFDVTGTSVQALSNSGYMPHNDYNQVVVTLPASPALGDIVAVSGLGRAGFKIAQNAGQSIYTGHLPGGVFSSIWTPRTNGLNNSTAWRAVASSYDGSKLVIAASGNPIYYSGDGGYSWAASNAPAVNVQWTSLASSTDGNKMVATAYLNGVYVSSNAGASWTKTNLPAAGYRAVASSADGNKLVVSTDVGGVIYTSTNAGSTWTSHAIANSGDILNVVSSADGNTLFVQEFFGFIYQSNDSGATWAVTGAPGLFWAGLAASADGIRLVAVGANGGAIYTSEDGGATWGNKSFSNSISFSSVASSADGTRLVGTAVGGQIWVSSNSGVSWTAKESVRSWAGVASSSDGLKLVAVGTSPNGIGVYTSTTTNVYSTTPGVIGGITGVQYDAIHLQYNGSGLFTVLNSSGTFLVQ
jgi:hypothetical protein